jgi:hypothetical protein
MVVRRDDAGASSGDAQGSSSWGQKRSAMNRDLIQQLRARRDSPSELVTCSLCLSVRRGSKWMDAERVIRELRSFEHVSPPRLQPGVCEDCAEAIFARRARAAEDSIAA